MFARLIAVLIFAVICYGVLGEDGETGIAMLLLPVSALLSLLILSQDG